MPIMNEKTFAISETSIGALYSAFYGGEEERFERLLTNIQTKKPLSLPYPWCRFPSDCANRGSCPRDPNCGE